MYGSVFRSTCLMPKAAVLFLGLISPDMFVGMCMPCVSPSSEMMFVSMSSGSVGLNCYGSSICFTDESWYRDARVSTLPAV